MMNGEVLLFSIQDEIVGRTSASSSSVATSLMDDTSPESVVGKKSESMIQLNLIESRKVHLPKYCI